MNDTCPAELFDKFRIIDTLKKDMHTGVYLAYHIYLDKEIILKTLNTESVQDKNVLERFKREARILARLDHPNIIKVLDFGTYDKYFYISFEYFTGSNLREAILSGKLKEESKLYILRQILSGLEAAHQLEIIHRDLKPENILINKECEIKIADFGLALSAREDIATNKYGIVGTPGYMSPEQIRGETLTPGSDLFSAGIIALELYTGINPFLGKDLNETINNILRFRENTLAEKTSGLSGEIKNIIAILLQKNLQLRAKQASDVLKLLPEEEEKSIEKTNAENVKGVLPPERKRNLFQNRYAFITAAFAFTLLAVIIFILYAQKNIYFRNPSGIDSTKRSISQVSSNVKESRDSLAKTIRQDNTGVLFAEGPPEEKKNSEEKKTPEEKTTLEGKKTPDENKTLNETPAGSKTVSAIGQLMVLCRPWAEVYIDSLRIDTTPLNGSIALKPGFHKLLLKHPDYPPYSQIIKISAHDTLTININFKNIVGYLDCNVQPWGDIFIDGIKHGQTPLKPIVLLPGRHKLLIKNPYFSDIQEEITINKGETYYYKYKFSKQAAR